MTCIDAMFQKGLHVAVYGERGVGKSSLARVLPAMVEGTAEPTLGAVRVDCNTADDFRSLWRKIYRELDRLDEAEAWPLRLDPEDIRYSLERLGRRVLIVIDELDRLEDDNALSLLADTLKTLGDHGVNVTVMVVGVAQSIEGLIGEHASIVRSIVQVPMPRMSEHELQSTLLKASMKCDVRFDSSAEWMIVRLAEGLPHFVHLLGLHGALAAVQDDRDVVRVPDVNRAIAKVIASHTMSSEYDRATRSPQPGHLFETVLLGCAFAPRNEVGYFRAADVRVPLSVILGRQVKIQTFQRHLKELSSEQRGVVLQREGPPRRHIYRFTQPLLEPFVKMRSVAKGLITEVQREELQRAQDSTDDARLFDPNEPGQTS